MGKLKLQMQISLDGFVATGPDDAQEWVTWAWEEIRPQVLALLDAADTILIGRKLAMDYIPHWENVARNPKDEMHELATRIVEKRKVVFGNVMQGMSWKNTEVAKGPLVDTVKSLKAQNTRDLVVYGGSSFVTSLIAESLVDEFHLYVNPVVLGKGTPIFPEIKTFRRLKLRTSMTFPSGIVLLAYEQE